MAKGWAQRWGAVATATVLVCATIAASRPAVSSQDVGVTELRRALADWSTALAEDPTAPPPRLSAEAGALGNVARTLRAGVFGDHLALPTLLGTPGARVEAQELPPAKPSRTNLRLALTVLTQTYGARDLRDILAAQGDRPPEAISFRGGLVTLPDILAAQDRERSDGVIRRPVVLWEDTHLRLGPGDALRLSRPDGAFVVSFGRVEVLGARLGIEGGENAHSAEFRPFFTIGGGGSLAMHGAAVSGLGFGGSPKFGGISVLAHPLMPVRGQTAITDTRFEDVHTVALIGRPDVVIARNRFASMRHNALLARAASGVRIRDNLFFGASPTNAVRVLGGSRAAHVRRNVLLGGERAGIVIGEGAEDATVAGNLVWNRDGAALKLDRTVCARVVGNVMLDGGQKGVEVRRSASASVVGNTILGQRTAAVWISAQAPSAETMVADNRIGGNGAGLSTAGAGQLLVSGNDLSRQAPRLFHGDISRQSLAMAKNLHGDVPVILTASGVQRLAAPSPELCPVERQP